MDVGTPMDLVNRLAGKFTTCDSIMHHVVSFVRASTDGTAEWFRFPIKLGDDALVVLIDRESADMIRNNRVLWVYERSSSTLHGLRFKADWIVHVDAQDPAVPELVGLAEGETLAVVPHTLDDIHREMAAAHGAPARFPHVFHKGAYVRV